LFSTLNSIQKQAVAMMAIQLFVHNRRSVSPVIIDKEAALAAPKVFDRRRQQLSPKLAGGFLLPLIAKEPAERSQGVVHRRGGVKVERALFAALLLVGDMVHPNRRDAELLHGQETVAALDAFEISSEPEQTRVRLAHRVLVRGVEVMNLKSRRFMASFLPETSARRNWKSPRQRQ
jgi:hypothetical protein